MHLLQNDVQKKYKETKKTTTTNQDKQTNKAKIKVMFTT